MNIKAWLGKKAIKKKNHVWNLLVKINLLFFHYDNRRRWIHQGNEDAEKKYYVIRPRGITEGLLSSWFGVLDHVTWALENGYIPVVDFTEKNKKYCQYYVEREINGSKNAWEYFFTQPYGISADEVYNKKNVLLCGWTLTEKKEENVEDKRYKEVRRKYSELIGLQQYVKDIVIEKKSEIFLTDNILGVFIRGTDYTSLKPYNHPIQPTIDEMMEKVEEVVNEFEIENIYLVTEDKTYHEVFVKKYGERIITVFDSDIEYRDGELLQNVYTDDPYDRGLKYLVRVLLLNECRFLVSSVASGSLFAKMIRENAPEYEYWFELGNYGVTDQ